MGKASFRNHEPVRADVADFVWFEVLHKAFNLVCVHNDGTTTWPTEITQSRHAGRVRHAHQWRHLVQLSDAATYTAPPVMSMLSEHVSHDFPHREGNSCSSVK